MTTTTTSQEVIWDNKTIKWTEKIETVSPDYIEVPDYSYGNWQETLDAGIALRNNNVVPTWATVIKTVYKWAGSWTWFETITWLWTVTSCEVYAWEDDEISWERWSRSVSNPTPAGSLWIFVQDNKSKTTNRIIHVQNVAAWTSTLAYIEEYVTDWIKFNFATDDKSIYYTIIAHN